MKIQKKWMPVDKKMPESGVPVIAFVTNVYGHQTRRLRARYAEKYFLLSVSDDFNDSDMFEEGPDGGLYCPEGWYEATEYSDVDYKIDGEVTHWMSLPQGPVK